MSDTVLKIENVYKRYRLGMVDSNAFKEDLQAFWAKLRGKADPFDSYITANELAHIKNKDEIKSRYVWALQDINFEVKQGEIVGIIGKNGAGKSTLLKLLSKTTAPTRGQIKVKGRIASLLEVGTGFHPELTGRENIYLNGMILGMTKREVTKHLDEIIDFAGIDAYIDTPVKRYSSGMYVRLGFAVAAHLLSDILIVDEVLAVGDAEFQKKCIGKMKDVSQGEGRTVLFVSHNMQSIKSLCNSGLYLKNGMVVLQDHIEEVAKHYLKDGIAQNVNIILPIIKEDITIHNFTIKQNNEFISEFSGDFPIDLEVDFEIYKDLSKFRIGFFVKSQYGELITRNLLADWNGEYDNLKKGRYVIGTSIPYAFLTTGSYVIEVHSSRYGIVDYGTCEATSTTIQINAPINFNPQYPSERSFGTILWNQKFNFYTYENS